VTVHIRINRNREIPFKGKLPVSPEMVINPRKYSAKKCNHKRIQVRL